MVPDNSRIREYIINRLKLLNETEDGPARHELCLLLCFVDCTEPDNTPANEGLNPKGPRYL
jgi:hypothetical protein